MPTTKAEDPKDIRKPEYSPDEYIFRKILIQRLESARDQRDNNHVEFDGMTYKEYWQSNAKASNSFLSPKINKQDVRVTSGTTHEKKNTLLSSLLNYNLQPDIEAYDKFDQFKPELGNVMEDLIKKSRRMEVPDYETKRILIYGELLDQGDVFVEDVQVEFSLPEKTLGKFSTKLSEMQWKVGVDKVYKYCSANLICGLNVYMGNVREFFLENQPYVFIRRLIPRAEAMAMYGEWERWRNVPEKIEKAVEDGSDAMKFNDWTLEDLESDMVEEIKYYNKWENNYMILLTGVMMLPVRRDDKGRLQTFPLSSLTGKCEYPLIKGSLEPISKFFAYSKSIPAKTKVDQHLFDEMLKAIIVKTRKSYNPPIANNTGTALSTSINYPGTIHNDVDPNKIQEIGNNTGVTSSEFNTIEFIRGIIDQKSVSSVFEGNQTKGQQTAREIVELKQQSMMKLGLAILGVVNLEKGLSKLRLLNILKYWTDPIDTDTTKAKEGLKKIYRNVTVDTEFEDGTNGQRMIEFVGSEEDMPTDDQVSAEAEILGKRRNKKITKNYLNAEMLKTLDYNFYFEIVPTEKNTSALKLAQFEESISKMMTIFAPVGKMPNVEYLADRWAVMSGEDPNRVWQKQQQPQGMPGAPMEQPSNQMAAQLTPQELPKPSVNTLLSN